MYRASSPVTACPRCQRALEERRIEMQSILACASCGGVWLDTAQTFLVFKRLKGGEAFVEGSEEIAMSSRAQRPDTERAGICPIGGEEMTLCEAEGIRIDRCSDHGTWFDAHELRLIVATADEPGVIEVAVDVALDRTTKWLSRVLWGDQTLPR